jgi:hypothetical protein
VTIKRERREGEKDENDKWEERNDRKRTTWERLESERRQRKSRNGSDKEQKRVERTRHDWIHLSDGSNYSTLDSNLCEFWILCITFYAANSRSNTPQLSSTPCRRLHRFAHLFIYPFSKIPIFFLKTLFFYPNLIFFFDLLEIMEIRNSELSVKFFFFDFIFLITSGVSKHLRWVSYTVSLQESLICR